MYLLAVGSVGLAYLALDMLLPATELRLLASCQRKALKYSVSSSNSHLSVKSLYMVHICLLYSIKIFIKSLAIHLMCHLWPGIAFN